MENNEAPVVMFTNYKRTDGFEISLTMRGDDLGTVATNLDLAIKGIILKGGTPVSRSFKGSPKVTEYVEGRVCPKDGAKLLVGQGKVKERCENNKYSFTEKKNIGSCDYIVWNQMQQSDL